MEFRHRERMPLTMWLGINSLAAILGLFATLRLVIWIWNFLYGFYQVPILDFWLFPASKDFTLRLFFIVGFSVAGVLIGLVIGLVKWWLLRHSGGMLSRQVLLSTTTGLIGLPLSYELVAIFNDLFKFNSSFLNSFPPYLLLALFLIYFIGGVIASIGEWLILNQRLFFLLWVLVNTLIWPVVWFVGSLSALYIYRFLSKKFYHDPYTDIWYIQPVNWQMHVSAIFALLIAGAIVGVGVGFVQWLALRHLWPIPAQWIGASVLGCLAAIPISYGIVEILRSQLSINLFFLMIASFVGGLGSGIGERLILKRYTSSSIWWLLANMFGWGMSGMLPGPLFLFMGLVSGLVTGASLVVLSKHSIEEESIQHVAR